MVSPLNTIYEFLDGVWQSLAEKVFVRFQFTFPIEEIQKEHRDRPIVFSMTSGGIIEWLILSSWSRKQGLGAILVCNRKKILLLAKPLYFLQILFRRRSYSELFLNKEKGPRLLFATTWERKKPFEATRAEHILADLYQKNEKQPPLKIYPVFMLWRKFAREDLRRPSEYLLGLASSPNLLGKCWYLLRKRRDSTVRSLEPIYLEPSSEMGDSDESEGESYRVAKETRRKILVSIQQELRVVLGPRIPSATFVKETLLREEEIQNLISEIAKEQGVDRKKILLQAYKNLGEIVATYRFRTIEVLYVFLRWLFTKVFDGVDYKEEEVQAIRDLVRKKPLVYVCAHRSHLDYLVIPYVLFVNDMMTPHIVAGINLSFWPLGPILRSAGAFFIRRSFRGDRLYALCLKKYVEFLIKNRINFLFFIEGTRSRSGKMLAPAYGVLKNVMEAFENKASDDIAMIPVSFVYDEVPEERSYNKEASGGKKEAENFMGVLKSGKIIQRKIGKVYLRMGGAISTKAVYESEGNRLDLLLQKVAFRLCKSICDVTPVTPKSIVSAVFLAHPTPPLTLETIVRISREIGDYIRVIHPSLSANDEPSDRRSIERTLRVLKRTGILIVDEEAIPRNFYLEEKRRPTLNYYKNTGLHVLVIPSILFLAFYRTLKSPVDRKDKKLFWRAFENHALELRNLFKFEFFFSPRVDFLQELDKTARYYFGDQDWHSRSVEDVLSAVRARFSDTTDIWFYLRILGDLLEAYRVAFEAVRKFGVFQVEKKALAQRILRFSAEKNSKESSAFPESRTEQNYGNALAYMSNLAILSEIKIENKSGFEMKSWGVEAQKELAKITAYMDLLEERPHIKN